MSESEKEIPKIQDVPPDQVEEVVKMLEEMGLIRGENCPFELRIRLTESREVDVNVIWSCEDKQLKDIAIVLDALTTGYLNKQILMAIAQLAGTDKVKLKTANTLIGRWNRIRESNENRPYIDSFQPLPQEGHQ